MKQSKYKAIIVGSGISGLYVTLKLGELLGDKNILLITKSGLKDSNSYYAQGGMVAVLKENSNDSVELHAKDTIVAGAGLTDETTVKFISKKSDEVVKDLLKFGVDFDKENGEYTLTKEAAHSINRILHAGGDATGREMEVALCKSFLDTEIPLYENTMGINLLVENNNCFGIKIYHTDTSLYETVYSDVVILATGGIGQLYECTTNPIGATGDGLALAYNAGARLRDMEFVQFHPTAFAIDDKKNHNRFLISEAVRGEGAKLCDENGYEFMSEYDERKELAPRDIVARSIFQQMQKTNKNNVYLNATVIGKEKLLKRFPTIAQKCLEYGIDITKDYIPVAPAAHYFMGGVETNLYGETSINNLYAIGEVASTGLHGANRLASNSLMECVVCAYETAKYIAKNLPNKIPDYDEQDKEIDKKNRKNINDYKKQIKHTMWKNAGIYRSQESLENALEEIKRIESEVDIPYDKDSFELYNMIIVAELIIKSAIQRKESRGAHFRTDYTQTDKIAKHSEIIKGEKLC